MSIRPHRPVRLRLRRVGTPVNRIRGRAELWILLEVEKDAVWVMGYSAQNLGTDTLTSVDILYNVRGGMQLTYEWSGSLGFQDVRSSLGIVIESPTYRLGKSGIMSSVLLR